MRLKQEGTTHEGNGPLRGSESADAFILDAAAPGTMRSEYCL